MNVFDIKFPTKIDTIATWGAFTGTLGLIIHFLTFNRDKAHIVIDVQRNMMVVNDPRYDPIKTYTNVIVSNRGRRPVIISSAGYQYMTKNGGAILADSMKQGSRKISEGESISYLMEESVPDDFDEILYFFASDATGRSFKKYVAPFYKRFSFWLLHLTHLRHKPSVVSGRKRKNHENNTYH